jgi:hypothetical protein
MFGQGSTCSFKQARLLARLHGIGGLRERIPGLNFDEHQRSRVRDNKVDFPGFGAQPLRQHGITL